MKLCAEHQYIALLDTKEVPTADDIPVMVDPSECGECKRILEGEEVFELEQRRQFIEFIQNINAERGKHGSLPVLQDVVAHLLPQN